MIIILIVIITVYHLLTDEQLRDWNNYENEYIRGEITFQVSIYIALSILNIYNYYLKDILFLRKGGWRFLSLVSAGIFFT